MSDSAMSREEVFTELDLHGARRPGGILQELAPQVLAAVARRHGRFDLAEDATQERSCPRPASGWAARAWPTPRRRGRHACATASSPSPTGRSWRRRRRSPAYCIIDVATAQRAEEVAARWPDDQRWGMEIRALMHGGGEEA